MALAPELPRAADPHLQAEADFDMPNSRIRVGERRIFDEFLDLPKPKFDLEDLHDSLDPNSSQNTEPKQTRLSRTKSSGNGTGQSDFEKSLQGFVDNPIVKAVPVLGLWSSILLNGFSALTHLIPSLKNHKGTAKMLGKWGTKAFQFTNGAINTLENIPRRNWLMSGVYSLEIPIMVAVDQAKTFLARGIVSGGYTIMNAVKLMLRKFNYKDVADNFASFGKAIGMTRKHIASDFFKNLKSHETGLMSMLGGLGKILGAGIWMLTGNMKIGAILRSGSGLIQIAEQLKPGHLKERKMFWLSGLLTGIGTSADMLTKLFKSLNEDFMVALSLATDCLGLYFLRLYQNTDESKKAQELKPALA